jgi:hypothetical protein
MPLQKVNPDRYQIFPGVTLNELSIIAKDPEAKTLQFAEPLSDNEIQLLQTVVFKFRPDIMLRVFGHYGHSCDLSFLKTIVSLKNISVDCLQNAIGVQVLTKFPDLEKLAIGIYNLDNFDFLKDVSSGITELSIEKTSSKKPSIEVIKRFTNLRYLYLEGHEKGIEVVKSLKKLEKIVLRSISTKDLSYLEELDNLWSVDIKLGGIKQFNSLTKVQNLKYLELWQIKGLGDLQFISEIKSLQHLFIQSLKQVTVFPNLENLKKLKRLSLENLKGLTDLTALEFIPNLEDFLYVLAENQQPENLIPVLKNSSVKNVLCKFGSDKKNNHFDKLAKEFGKNQFSFQKFNFE